jgi:hypothetical protein
MKKLALGIATAAVLFTAVAPAMAQVGVRVGPFAFGVGPGPYYGSCGDWNNWCHRGYYDYYGGPNVVIRGGGGWHGHPGVHGHFQHH